LNELLITGAYRGSQAVPISGWRSRCRKWRHIQHHQTDDHIQRYSYHRPGWWIRDRSQLEVTRE